MIRVVRKIRPHIALSVALVVTMVVAPAFGMWWGA